MEILKSAFGKDRCPWAVSTKNCRQMDSLGTDRPISTTWRFTRFGEQDGSGYGTRAWLKTVFDRTSVDRDCDAGHLASRCGSQGSSTL